MLNEASEISHFKKCNNVDIGKEVNKQIRTYKDTLAEHVGKLFLVGFDGTEITNEARLLVTKYKVGSIILSGRNFINVKQTKKLIRDLQSLALESGYTHPLLFAIDEEGGMMNSLFDKNYITQFPGSMALAATGSEELVYQVYKKMALELKSIGFSLYLGPVLDILKNDNSSQQQMIGVRSFGYDAELVTKFGKSATRALKDAGIFNCGKHFPGYGSATINSNFGLPMILETSEQLMNFNLVPYKEMIQDNLLDCILVGGCAVPMINGNDVHACLSPTIVTNILREKLNFDGIVISECLLLEALDKTFGVIQGCISAFSVDCDLIMLCNNFKLQEEAIVAMRSVINDGLLDKAVIDGSLKRISSLQSKLPTWTETFNLQDLSPNILKEHKLLSKLAYEKSITVIRNEGIPISNFLTPAIESSNGILLLTPLIKPLYETLDEVGNKSHINNLHNENKNLNINYAEDVFVQLGKLLADYKPGYKISHTSYNSNGLTSFHEELIMKSKVIIFVTAEVGKNMYQVGVSKHVYMLCNRNFTSEQSQNKKLDNISRQMIIISVSSPLDFLYDINLGGYSTGYICTYDYTINALSNIPKVLFGDLQPPGRIPGIRNSGKLNVSDKSKPLYHSTTRQGKHSWLVQVFDFGRDWENLVKLLKNNGILDYSVSDTQLWSYKEFFKEQTNQKSFVVRNTSSNSLLGISVTWLQEGAGQHGFNVGKILLLLVDKSKRNIAIGHHLYSKTVKYLFETCKCSSLYLGSDFPKLTFGNDLLLNVNDENRSTINFFRSLNWNFDIFFIGNRKNQNEKGNDHLLQRKAKRGINYLMKLENVHSWKVSENLLRQLQVVGIMFDICKNPSDILSLYQKKLSNYQKDELNQTDDNDSSNYELYSELNKNFMSHEKDYFNKSGNLDIIVALEPTRRSVVGSLVVFNNKSKFSKFFPYLQTSNSLNIKGKNGKINEQKFACITGHFIDPLYATLSEVFKLGLICTALIFIKNQYGSCSKCFIDGIEEKQLKSLQDNGFEEVGKYHNFYSELETRKN